MAPSDLAYFGAMNLVSITFSLRHDESMLELAWQKLVYANEIISVTVIQEFCYLIGYKTKRNLHQYK